MSDELLPNTWTIVTTVSPTEDFRFVRIQIELHRPDNRVPIRVNSAGTTDLLFEKIQGEQNNLLRQLVNSFDQLKKQYNKPGKRNDKVGI